MLLKHASDHLSVIFQFARLYLSSLMQNNPSINCPPSATKSFLEKVPPNFMENTMPLLHWKIMWGCIVHAPSIFARTKCILRLVNNIEFGKRDCMTEQVSGLRHYIRLGILSVKNPKGTSLTLINLFMKPFFIFKFKQQ